MDERRRRKRTDLDTHLTIKRLDGSSIAEYEIDVIDVSLTGIGFMCKEELEVGVIYEGNLATYGKVFLDIVRKQEMEGTVNYGAHFVGMPDLYKRKIGIYQAVEENKKQSEESAE